MIEKLYIKDFAIVSEIDISFKNGLTVITGETGAGKSILLQALNVALGNKTSKTMVRSNSDRAIIETKLNSAIYRRIVNKSGRARSFLNDEPLSENDFRSASASLVDFHGQHEQQYIMQDSSHIDYLDAYCGIDTEVRKCVKLFNSIKQDTKILSNLLDKKHRMEQHQELLAFQLNEIATIDPTPEEDIELEDELRTIKHLEELVETANRLSLELTDEDESVYNQISAVLPPLEKLVKIDQKLNEYTELIKSATHNIQETSVGLQNYANSLNHDKNRLVEIQDRLGSLDNLKRKYGGTIASILGIKDQLSEELSNFSSIDRDINRIKNDIADEKAEYEKLAVEIHNKRADSIKRLSQAVETEMLKLNMPDSRFAIHIVQKETDESFAQYQGKPVMTTEKGFDFVQFLLSANPGEQLKPLVEIASGGEISRIMLAIKTVFQHNDPVDTLVFDEIDSGISGVAAEKVANSLVNLSKSKQVICITHLPQIAQNARHHLHISKFVEDYKTVVTAVYLNKEDREKAISQLSTSEKIFN